MDTPNNSDLFLQEMKTKIKFPSGINKNEITWGIIKYLAILHGVDANELGVELFPILSSLQFKEKVK
jgi:hypothetical protein